MTADRLSVEITPPRAPAAIDVSDSTQSAAKNAGGGELYRSMGFFDIPPYASSPMPDTVYMELVL